MCQIWKTQKINKQNISSKHILSLVYVHKPNYALLLNPYIISFVSRSTIGTGKSKVQFYHPSSLDTRWWCCHLNCSWGGLVGNCRPLSSFWSTVHCVSRCLLLLTRYITKRWCNLVCLLVDWSTDHWVRVRQRSIWFLNFIFFYATSYLYWIRTSISNEMVLVEFLL